MGIRNIKGTPELGNNPFEQIFQWQNNVLLGYKEKENLPDWPLNIEDKEHQKIIKDYTGRVIEELGESFECLKIINQNLTPFNEALSRGNEKEISIIRNELINELWNLNEELSDTLHFLVGLDILSDINVRDMILYSDMKELSCTCNNYNVDMKYFLESGLTLLTKDGIQKDSSPFSILHDYTTEYAIKGGRIMSESIFRNISILMWQFTHELQMSRNFLKKKPWRESGMPTDVRSYRERLIMANLRFFAILKYLGMGSKSIFEIYYRKNQIIKQRINEINKN